MGVAFGIAFILLLSRQSPADQPLVPSLSVSIGESRDELASIEPRDVEHADQPASANDHGAEVEHPCPNWHSRAIESFSITIYSHLNLFA
ncbi:MAG: hypothetical protein CL831_10635 [Crocinitomicaceae bacterium]|nr:hypothetical protein [Crocinitomicaceae bacterium]